MKKTFLVLLALLFISFLIPSTLAFAGQDTKIITVDKEISFEYLQAEVSPIVKDGYTLVPLRAIAEKFGYKVTWAGKTVEISNKEDDLTLTIGSITAFSGEKTIEMSVAPQILEDRLFIPLRYVSEFFGLQVTWLKGIDDNYYIWVSAVQLLNDRDVDPDEENYFILFDDPAPFYALKAEGETARGINLGDSYDKVIEKYGEPHIKIIYDDGEMTLRYYTPGIPNTGDVCALYFYFDNNIVTEINIDHSN